MFKIAVLVSGGGTNLQSIIDAVENKYINCKIEMVIRKQRWYLCIRKSKKHNIDTFVVRRKEYGEKSSDKILELTKGKS